MYRFLPLKPLHHQHTDEEKTTWYGKTIPLLLESSSCPFGDFCLVLYVEINSCGTSLFLMKYTKTLSCKLSAKRRWGNIFIKDYVHCRNCCYMQIENQISTILKNNQDRTILVWICMSRPLTLAQWLLRVVSHLIFFRPLITWWVLRISFSRWLLATSEPRVKRLKNIKNSLKLLHLKSR